MAYDVRDPDARIKNLPKWAQSLIGSLHRRATSLADEVERLRSVNTSSPEALAGSNTHIVDRDDRRFRIAVDEDAKDIQFVLARNRQGEPCRVVTAQVYPDRHGRDVLELATTAMPGRLVVRPRVSNVITIDVEQDM